MIITLILILSISVFAIRTIIFSLGASIEKQKKIAGYFSGELPFVSIIIPARNEEKNIGSCLESVYSNSYPKDKFEIIAINDRSEDKTGEILQSLQSRFENLKIVNITSETVSGNLKGKPGALQQGIKIASGSILMMTDADCTVGNRWIETIAKTFEDKNTGLVASFTHIKGNKLFEKFQAVEWIYTHTMGSSGIGLGLPLGCFGNNLSVRKSVYDELGGYENIRFSVTEDLALLQAVFSKGWKVRYITHPDADIDTLPCENLSQYFNQHHRWASGGLNLGWKGAFFVITSAMLWAGLITAIATFQPLWIVGIILSRMLLDYSLITPALRTLHKDELHLWVFPSVIFFIIVEAIVPFLLLKKNVTWKGQVFNQGN